MSLNKRKLTYSLAINEALKQKMKVNKNVFVMGQGTKSPWYVGNTCKDLIKKFGEKRVIDTPISENAMTGASAGAAIAGMRPVMVHARMDFMLYAMDPIINEAANWSYMFGGASSVPVVFWGVINRGGEQGAQHSQALHSLFAHIPGLKVVMPSTPYDAKGLMISAIEEDNPVVYIDDRWLYNDEGIVPSEIYSTPIGKGVIRKKGKDITIVSISYTAREALKAAEKLKGIDAEVLDLRSLKPLDLNLIEKSFKKTKRMLIVDPGWKSFGFSGEIASSFKGEIRRIGLPDTPAPVSRNLEQDYYLSEENILKAVKSFFNISIGFYKEKLEK